MLIAWTWLLLAGCPPEDRRAPVAFDTDVVDSDGGDTDAVDGDTDPVDSDADTDADTGDGAPAETDAPPPTPAEACAAARDAYVACYLDGGIPRGSIDLDDMCDGVPATAATPEEAAIAAQYACIARTIDAYDCAADGALDGLRDALAPCGS